LLILTDENFKEQTVMFFYIFHYGNGQWITRASVRPGRISFFFAKSQKTSPH
jgi:hypothetical protein